MANIGASQKPRPVTRYTDVRKAQEKRMGTGSLIGVGSISELTRQMERSGTGVMTSSFSAASQAHRKRNGGPTLASMDPELAQLEADIVMQETQLAVERARAVALKRRADNSKEIAMMRKANSEQAQNLGDAIPSVRVPADRLTTTSGSQGALVTSGGGIPAALPRGIKFEKLVLCFSVWFKEPWYEEAGEGFDVRTFMLRYYMADQSLEIVEPAVLNSGKPSGCFLKRTILKKSDGNPFEPADLAVGKQFQLSGRTFTVHDADQATRAYFDKYIPESAPLVRRLAIPVAPKRQAFEPGMKREVLNEPSWKGQARAQRTNPGAIS